MQICFTLRRIGISRTIDAGRDNTIAGRGTFWTKCASGVPNASEVELFLDSRPLTQLIRTRQSSRANLGQFAWISYGRIEVAPPDPQSFDTDFDGIGCGSNWHQGSR